MRLSLIYLKTGASTGTVPMWRLPLHVVWDGVAPCCCGCCVVSALDRQHMQLMPSHLRAECPWRKSRGDCLPPRGHKVAHLESNMGFKMHPDDF